MAKRKTRGKKSSGKSIPSNNNPPRGKNPSSGKNTLNSENPANSKSTRGEKNSLSAKKAPIGKNPSNGNEARLSVEPARDDGQLTMVAIGASAGGVEAASELIKNLPTNAGLSFVLVQHLDPKHHSMLTDLLSKQTKME